MTFVTVVVDFPTVQFSCTVVFLYVEKEGILEIPRNYEKLHCTLQGGREKL